MKNESKNLVPALLGRGLISANTDAILACNSITEQVGLTLSREQTVALVETCEAALKKTGRIEFGAGITEKIIKAFYDSPHISEENYEVALHELIELFYTAKNDTSDAVGDDELIAYFCDEFNGECHGSTELLEGRSLPALVARINSSFRDYFENAEVTDD